MESRRDSSPAFPRSLRVWGFLRHLVILSRASIRGLLSDVRRESASCDYELVLWRGYGLGAVRFLTRLPFVWARELEARTTMEGWMSFIFEPD